jgi:DivIVA domain-containing protein
VPALAGRSPRPDVAAVSARDVREAQFPLVLGGYDLAEVDRLLRDLVQRLPEVSRPTWDADPVSPAPGPGPQLRTSLRGYARRDVDAFLVRCAHSLRTRVAELPALAPLTAQPRTGEPLTARDVDGAQFRLVHRGYAPQAVDALLDQVRERLPG